MHPSGYEEWENLNKHSTHPNPWKPPSMADQFFQYPTSFYKIYKPDFEKSFMKEDPTKNHMRSQPFADRLATWTWRGLLGGVLVSYVDIVFITQSVNLKTNVARFLYLTPPTMCIPMAYVTTREVLEHTVGDKLWTYTAAALPGAAIWGVFRKNLRSGMAAFAFFAVFGGVCKMNADTSGLIYNTDGIGQEIWTRDRPNWLWNFRTGSKRHEEMDPGPYWKQFVTEEQDPAKDSKV